MKPAESQTAQISHLKVLIIEDNPGDARLIREVLSEEKGATFELEHFDRLNAALLRIPNGGIDVILSDLSLPDSHGLETLHRERKIAPDLPIVVLTGTYEENLGVEALRTGADDYLLKEKIDGHTLSRALRYAVERKKAEERLRKMAADLARSKEELDQLELFAFVVTHDMQEPLHKISILGDLLMAQCAPKLETKDRSYVERMQAAAKRMSRMFEQLRELSRIVKEGKSFENVSAEEVLKAVLAELEPARAEAGAQIELNPSLPSIRGDRWQIRQLFQHLLNNAFKFRRKNEPLRILIRGRVLSPEWVEIIMEDNGIGFDEKYVDRIFKPFQKLHRAGEYEGSGIGLAICEKIVVRHGGKISAKSVQGKGSTFIVTLPSA